MYNIQEEFIILRDFLKNLLKHFSWSENTIFAFFNKNIRAYKPITYYYESLKDLKIQIQYGDRDWCPVQQGEDVN